jgi:hypothetical protein
MAKRRVGKRRRNGVLPFSGDISDPPCKEVVQTRGKWQKKRGILGVLQVKAPLSGWPAVRHTFATRLYNPVLTKSRQN